jgi:hypothetical protein
VERSRRPVVTGPVVGGRHGRPFGSSLLDVASYGYLEEEYFIEGSACRYVPTAGCVPGHDGRWDAEPGGGAPYKTRMIVYRPADPARFNGAVFVCWNNVSGGHDIMTGLSAEVATASRRKHAIAFRQPSCARRTRLTVQRVGR